MAFRPGPYFFEKSRNWIRLTWFTFSYGSFVLHLSSAGMLSLTVWDHLPLLPLWLFFESQLTHLTKGLLPCLHNGFWVLQAFPFLLHGFKMDLQHPLQTWIAVGEGACSIGLHSPGWTMQLDVDRSPLPVPTTTSRLNFCNALCLGLILKSSQKLQLMGKAFQELAANSVPCSVPPFEDGL